MMVKSTLSGVSIVGYAHVRDSRDIGVFGVLRVLGGCFRLVEAAEVGGEDFGGGGEGAEAVFED